MEKDNEVKGSANSYDYGGRIYDPRLGRWLACDPLAAKYPGWSSYHAMANSPLIIKDPNGKDWEITITDDGKGNRAIQIVVNAAVLNSSADQTIDMAGLEHAIKSQIESTFHHDEWTEGVGSYKVNTTVNIRTVTSADKV